jgi:hypothetical protein
MVMRTHETVELHLHGDAAHEHRLRSGIVALAFCLDGGQHHECAVAREDVGYQAVVVVCAVSMTGWCSAGLAVSGWITHPLDWTMRAESDPW